MALFNSYTEASNYAATTSGLQSIGRRADGKYEVKPYTDSGGTSAVDAFRRRVIEEQNRLPNIPQLSTIVSKPTTGFGQVQPAQTPAYVAAPAPEQTPAISPSVQYANQDWMTLASSLNGRMPSPAEINPLTGKQYGVNPATGQWDDNYFNNVVIPSLRSAYTAIKEDIALYESIAPSTVDEGAIQAQVTKEMNEYYNKLIDDFGGDVNLAIQRMEEDYRTGTRKTQDVFKTGVEDLYSTVPTEMSMLLEQLAGGGALGTPLGRKDSELGVDINGQRISPDMPTKMQFGGLAGKKIGTLVKGQLARQKALEKAKLEQEEELGLAKSRGLADIRTQETRGKETLEQKKREGIQDLTETRYASALRKAGELKAPIALSPYI